MPSAGGLFETDGDDQRSVKAKCLNRRPARRGQPQEIGSLPLEVQIPSFFSGIEQGRYHTGRWIDRGLASPFSQRT